MHVVQVLLRHVCWSNRGRLCQHCACVVWIVGREGNLLLTKPLVIPDSGG